MKKQLLAAIAVRELAQVSAAIEVRYSVPVAAACFTCVASFLLQLGNAQTVKLFQLKQLKTLQATLIDEKLCRDTLQRLIPLSPVDNFEGFKAALEHAARLEFDPAKEPLVHEAQRLFASVKDRIEV